MFDASKVESLYKQCTPNILKKVIYLEDTDIYLPKRLVFSTLKDVSNTVYDRLDKDFPLVAIGLPKERRISKSASLFYVHSRTIKFKSEILLLQGLGNISFSEIKEGFLINPQVIDIYADYPEDCNLHIDYILKALNRLLVSVSDVYLEGSNFRKELQECSSEEALKELFYHVGPLLKFFAQDQNLQDRLYDNLLSGNRASFLINDVLYIVKMALEISNLELSISDEVQKKMEHHNLDFYLREKLRVIQNRLGGNQVAISLEQRVRNKLKNYPEALEKCLSEVERLSSLSSQSPDSEFLRNYLEKVLSLPWGKIEDISQHNHTEIKSKIDKSHYGMDQVKSSLMDFVSMYRRDINSVSRVPTMCIVGPPGTGKTSIAKSLAKIIGKQVCHLSLAGLADQHELRGHRRTYVGAAMGCIMEAITRVKVDNPIFILDEVDKIGSPQLFGALLELLDESQNQSFRDSFIDLGYDLSKVWFICTANETHNIPRPLYDRMRIVNICGYTLQEKLHIAQKYIIPQSLKTYGLSKEKFALKKQVIKDIIDRYTFESGVRSLKRCIEILMMKVVTYEFKHGKKSNITLSLKSIVEMLDIRSIPSSTSIQKPCVGACNGLSYITSGLGDVLAIETILVPNGKGEIHCTGNLGKVLRESVQVAYLYSLHMFNTNTSIKLSPQYMKSKHDIHVHLPEAVAKDGPSAGLALVVAIVSLMSNTPIKGKLAFTGEVNLRGQVMPVGGIREKIQGASLRGIDVVCLPKANKEDFDRIPQELHSKLKVYFISDVFEACKIAFIRA